MEPTSDNADPTCALQGCNQTEEIRRGGWKLHLQNWEVNSILKVIMMKKCPSVPIRARKSSGYAEAQRHPEGAKGPGESHTTGDAALQLEALEQKCTKRGRSIK